MSERRKTLILGIGNSLLQDEGAGVHAVRMLAERMAGRDDIELMDGGTLSFTLAGAIEDAAQLIVIDAARFDGEPGATRVFEGEEMDAFIGGNRRCSVHEVSLIDLLSIARLADRLPSRRALIGIQPQDIEWGETPSPAVATALPRACSHALQLVEAWQT
ncbi:MAG: HyaD/HybD family hydrogenase maturation endopeptidase [Nitrosomonadales bacterium]|nr:HyaD/HybD family hydrogenase maturation endopeptidase [Nitrosomonadales bacterium]